MKNFQFNSRSVRIILYSLALFYLSQTPVYASDTPEEILGKFNASVTGEDAVTYVTGVLAAQLLSLDKELMDEFLRRNRMKAYQAHTRPVSDELQFVFVTSIEDEGGAVPASRQNYPVIYEFSNVLGQWKINNRLSGHIILDLFQRDYNPEQFHSKNFFQFDGKTVEMKSAFAYFKEARRDDAGTDVNIRFYPFQFQKRDIGYFKYNSEFTVEEAGDATTIASSQKYPLGEITLYIGGNKELISFCVNGFDFNEKSGSFNYCLQPDSFLDEDMTFSDNRLRLTLTGSAALADGKNLGWNIAIDLPIFREGI